MLNLIPLKKLRDRGDTIVEVLIATAVISLILGISYATVVHSTNMTQDAQSQSEALQLAKAQVEFLRAKGAPAAGQSCYDSMGNPTNSCRISPSGAATTVQPYFDLDISTINNGVYVVKATWYPSSAPSASMHMYYRPQDN
jgi:Tfp pilus assembly protein PilV